ncbi:MAG: glutamate racemase [Clostridia bacterium]|nr:glutamate racemase [Clostridia bacterium]
MDKRPIGIFDSGLGGLTVLKEISKIMPEEDLVYFGDSKRTPYGSKSKETIINFSIQDVNFLLSKNIKALVIACNTVSSNAINELKERFDIPIIEVISPGVSLSTRVTKNKRIGVIGTRATVESGAYESSIKSIDKNMTVFSKSCPLFVPLVEEGQLWWNHHITKEIIRFYLDEFIAIDVDTMVLGCTHYPLLIDAINEVLEGRITLINSAGEVAKGASAILEDMNLRNFSHIGETYLYTSDSAEKFIPLAKDILQRSDIHAEKIDIENY